MSPQGPIATRYEVDVDVPTGSDSDPNLSNGFNNIKAS